MKLHHWLLPHQFHHKKAIIISEVGFIVYAGFFGVLGIALLAIQQVKPSVLSYATNITVEDVIKYTNDERIKNGDLPVKNNPLLSIAAEKKARDMFAKNYWAHFGPNGESPWNFIQQTGYVYSAAGENLARDFDDSKSVVDAWMASKMGHRENLLNKNYQEMGIAVVNGTLLGQETTLVVQMFGKPYRPSTALLPEVYASEREPIPIIAQVSSSPSPTNKAVPVPSISASADKPLEEGRNKAIERQIISQSQPMPQPFNISQTDGKIRPLDITKPISLALLIFVSIFLFIDMIVIRRRGVIRLATHSFAHIAILAIVLVIILSLKAGQII